ncbi:MAG: flagellar type III secretion system pore protein FliP [Lachnospiraceae bacterium]|nr:flagellar type III secretion system pore protein FliP [Lachnospiraceae bacterium]
MITLIGGIFSYTAVTSYATGPGDTNAGQEDNDVNDTHADEENDITPFNLDIDLNNETDEGTLSATVQIVILLTILSIAPSFLIMLTSFTRIIIVLHFVRQALGTTTAPPNQVLVGLALFLTFYIMNPTFTAVYNNAIEPLNEGTVTTREAIDLGLEPLRDFMLANVNKKDLKLFIKIADNEVTDSYDDIPITTLIPAFICSELRAAFIIGFLIYIPFIVIDMVVASTLMSMGMMMLPPTTISAPFKILLFVLADGWNLVIGNLVQTFH